MSPDVRNVLTLMVVGQVPCAVAGGFSAAGDRSWTPWVLGFGAQAAYVVAALAWERIKRRTT